MAALCVSPAERARKMTSTILQRVQRDATQAAIAVAMGISAATISRFISDHLEKMTLILAHAGLKIVPIERVCVDPQMYEAMTRIASKAMADTETAQRLVWGDE